MMARSGASGTLALVVTSKGRSAASGVDLPAFKRPPSFIASFPWQNGKRPIQIRREIRANP
jgi:hypothetical protein